MDHRIALLFLVALLVTAAAPLAYAWARLLPEDAPPFQMHPQRGGATGDQETERRSIRRQRDPFATFLLASITASYALKFPGFPVGAGLQMLSRVAPMNYFEWIVMAGRAFFVVVPAIGAAYSVARPNPVRIPLVCAGLLVLGLWLASPYLMATLNR